MSGFADSPAEPERAAPLAAPVFVVCPPCSGEALLGAALLAAPGTWHAGAEPDSLLAGLPALSEGAPPDGNRLGRPPTPEEAQAVREQLLGRYGDLDMTGRPGDARPRLFDASPRSALRVPFLAGLFPDATFVHLSREPAEAIAETHALWSSGRAVTYPDLPGWEGPPWSLLLSPGWRELSGRSLEEIAVEQWVRVATVLLGDLEALAPERWCVASYDSLLAEPDEEVQRLFRFLGLGWHSGASLPFRRAAAGNRPEPPGTLVPHLGRARAVAERARQWIAAPTDGGTKAQPGKVRIFQSDSFAELIASLRSSLLVTTYQTNKLIAIRHDGNALDTHFRSFDRPMGIAVHDRGFALGTRDEVLDYRDFPAVAATLEPEGVHDSCFMPRNSHYTADIAIHDLQFAGGELWLAATRFSCLATIDATHSFVPRWKPPFVSELAAEDRCHLNGLAVAGDQPRYVTALGESDEAGGWRANKAAGGIVIDVPTGEIIARGLSMPHSPRWHDGRLWLLESGRGSLATCDPETGEVETVATMPGFTRGLAFSGDVAFVGLSQIRETATFGGLPIEELDERRCGVWAVDITSGRVIGQVRFEDTIQEIFDVGLAPGVRYPDIAERGSQVALTSWYLPARGASQQYTGK